MSEDIPKQEPVNEIPAKTEMQPVFTAEQKQKIVIAINDVAKLNCARCGNENFTLLDGYYSFPVSRGPISFQIFGSIQVTPCIGILCNRCGAINFHSLIVLGLLNEKGEFK